ncbi:MAG: glycosyltransferase, partial [Candidatus Omnitrophica bacterium]|nr:glycosyltransferase [Candidatus Omnitrophota bacterium]
MKVMHLATHLNTGGISSYILRLVEPLGRLNVNIGVLSSGGNLTPLFRERGAETFEFPIRTKNELHPKIYWAIPGICDLIRKKRIEILHAHTRITQVLAYWVQRCMGIPVVTTCHGFYKRRLGRRLLPAWGDYVIAISEPVSDNLKSDFHVPEAQIRIVNNAVDIVSLERAYKSHVPEEAKLSFGFGKD